MERDRKREGDGQEKERNGMEEGSYGKVSRLRIEERRPPPIKQAIASKRSQVLLRHSRVFFFQFFV